MKCLILLACLGLAYGTAPLLHEDAEGRIPSQYIVVLNEGATEEIRDQSFKTVASVHDAALLHSYHIDTFIGYSAVLSDEALAAVREDPQVQYVAVDAEAHALQNWVTQPNCPNWGAPSTSGPANWNGDADYIYDSRAGNGVDVYIIDTGILCSHTEFSSGRCSGGVSYVGGTPQDCNGHGTHVASSTAGAITGISKSARLVPVRVLDCNGSGSYANIIAGINWVTSEHRSNNRDSVANMSLGGSYNAALNSAVDSSVSAGVVHVVAAGNSNNDACNYSPASASGAITVGATDRSSNNRDLRSSFSSFGTCVNMWAPGSDIYGAWIGGSGNSFRTISGTSMASPHVAGQAAMLLSQSSGTPSNVRSRLTNAAHNGIIDLRCSSTSCNQSPNLMLHNGLVGPNLENF